MRRKSIKSLAYIVSSKTTNIPAINFSQLIPLLAFISTSDLYYVVMLWSSTDFASATPGWFILICYRALIIRSVRLVIAHKQSSTFWLKALHWLALVTNILPFLQSRTFLIMLLPEALSILSMNPIFIALYNVVTTYFMLA